MAKRKIVRRSSGKTYTATRKVSVKGYTRRVPKHYKKR